MTESVTRVRIPGSTTDLGGIAVFGGSDHAPGSAIYERARELGRLAAGRGVPIVTGGYGGVMEAASRGAKEHGGRTLGVTCATFEREPNAFLTDIEHHEDLFGRTRALITASRGFVILDGRAGTLAELTMLWALARARVLDSPIAVWDDTWSLVIRSLDERGRLDGSALAITSMVGDAEAAIACVLEDRGGQAR